MTSKPDGRHIVVRSFPAADRDFAAATSEALADAQAAIDGASALHLTVEDRLRLAYRNVRVRVQDELAELAPDEVIWYVYRDGRIRDVDASRERLYEVVAAARRTVKTTEATLEHSRSVSRLAGFDPDLPKPIPFTPQPPPSQTVGAVRPEGPPRRPSPD